MATLHRANSNQSPEIIVGENSKLNLYLPFKPQYPHTNSPNWSFYISLRNKLRAFGRRSKPFLLGDHFINSHNHNIWILLGENWSWSQLGLKGLSSSAYNFWPRWKWSPWKKVVPYYGSVKMFQFFVSASHYTSL